MCLQKYLKKKILSLHLDEVKGPMGMGKWDHINELCQLESIKTQWQAKYGKYPEKDEVDELFARFEPLLFSKLRSYAKPIEGVIEGVDTFT